MSNDEGIAQLNQQREAAKRASARTRAQPRHKPKERPAPPEQAPAAPAAGTPEQTPEPAKKPTPAEPKAAPVSPLTRATIYLDETAETLLEEVEILGRRQRPRVSVSRSTIVRVALERLGEELNPEQILQLVRERADTTPGKVGRPRI